MIWALPFLLVAGILLPLLAWSSYRHLASEAAAPESFPSPQAMAVQTIIMQAVVVALAWLAVVGTELTPSWASDLNAAALLAAVIVVLGGLRIAQLEARRPLGRGVTLRRRLRSVGLTKLWIAAMGAAALGEEFAYRGVLYLILGQALTPTLAALVSALLFGLAHLGQGWRGAILSAAFGVGLQVIAVLSGGLFLAMLAHLLYDLAAAWLARRLAVRDEHEAAA